MSESKPLAQAIDDFLDQHGMSPVTFGRKAMNDPHFVRDIKAEKPRRLWPETEAKARRFMATYRPAPAGASSSQVAAA